MITGYILVSIVTLVHGAIAMALRSCVLQEVCTHLANIYRGPILRASTEHDSVVHRRLATVVFAHANTCRAVWARGETQCTSISVTERLVLWVSVSIVRCL